MSYNLLLVGCGNMGRAMLAGWLDAGLVTKVVVVEPNASPPAVGEVAYVPDAAAVPTDFHPDMIVLAVKPQVLADVLPAYTLYAATTPFLSIAAGKTIAFFQQHLGDQAAIVRAMPNLPATVRRGVTVCAASDTANENHRALSTALLQAVGTVDWVPEDRIDAIMALSGCGPAYLFLMAEVLAEAGTRLGIDPAFAARLARDTITGAAELLRQSPENAATLRAQVTSKGGTTEAALKILMENESLLSVYVAALQAAAAKARELAD